MSPDNDETRFQLSTSQPIVNQRTIGL